MSLAARLGNCMSFVPAPSNLNILAAAAVRVEAVSIALHRMAEPAGEGVIREVDQRLRMV